MELEALQLQNQHLGELLQPKRLPNVRVRHNLRIHHVRNIEDDNDDDDDDVATHSELGHMYAAPTSLSK